MAKGHPYQVSGWYLKNYAESAQITVHGKVAPSPFHILILLKLEILVAKKKNFIELF